MKEILSMKNEPESPACWVDLTDVIKAMDERNDVGGPLHIAFDDGNVSDESIQFCLKTCETHWSVMDDLLWMILRMPLGFWS